MKTVKKDKEGKIVQTVIVKVGEAKKKRKQKRRRMKAKPSTTTQSSGGISVQPQFPMQQASILPPSSAIYPQISPSPLQTLTSLSGSDYRKLLDDILSLSIQSGQQKAMAIQAPMQPPIVIEPATTIAGSLAPPSVASSSYIQGGRLSPPQVQQAVSSIIQLGRRERIQASASLSKSQIGELRGLLKNVLNSPTNERRSTEKLLQIVKDNPDSKGAFMMGLREGDILRDESGNLDDNVLSYLNRMFEEEIAPV